MNPVVPSLDLLPLPAPVWVFKVLLHLTFVLHLLAMNFLLGGAFLSVVQRLRRGDEAQRLARWIEHKLPTAMAITVSLGVAPLLFVQALYGHLLYTSSVILAWPWLLVVPVLIVAYYGTYALSFRGDRFSMVWRTVGWGIFLALLYVSHVFVHNMSLFLRPDTFAILFHADPSGFNTNFSDPTIWPRYLHFLLSAVAVGGLMIAWMGAVEVKKGKGDGRFMVRQGGLWFIVLTALQYGVGSWFLLSLPREVMLFFMKSVLPMIAFIASLLLPIGSLVTASLALRHPRPLPWLNAAAGFLLLTIVAMVIVRDVVRDRMLHLVFDLAELSVRSQTSVLVIFLVLLPFGLAVMVWMVKAYRRGITS